jgi:molecular chaperone HscB
VVQQVSATTSAFSLLGVPAQFAVDAAELSKKHHKMQLRLHPDRFANVESDAVKDVAEAASSAVNEAKVALHDPLRRGLHMLEQQGHHVRSAGAPTGSEFRFTRPSMKTV